MKTLFMNTMSTGQVAKYIGITRDIIQTEIAAGFEPPAARAGGRYVWIEEDIDRLYRWIKARGRRTIKKDYSNA